MSISKKKNGKKFTLPVAVIFGFVPLANEVKYWFQKEGLAGLAKHIPSRIFPYDPGSGKWTTSNLRMGLYPIIAGFLVHKVVGGWFGVNRMLSSMKIPVIRL